MTTVQPQKGFAGQAGASSASSDFNKIQFMIRQMIGRMCTSIPVRVQAVSNSGGVSPIGNVDVTPLVNLVDGLGNATEHGTITGLPYCRVQGGQNAVILDPQVGDIGVAVFAQRDISAVKAGGWVSGLKRFMPGSRRRYDWSDGMYLYSIMSDTPAQYIQFTDTGINIMCPTLVTITAPIVNVMGVLQVNGVPVDVP